MYANPPKNGQTAKLILTKNLTLTLVFWEIFLEIFKASDNITN